MITSDTSVMKYSTRESVSDYSFPEFKPMFLDQADPAVKKEAIKVCGGVKNIACVFDYIATGNKELAESTKSTQDENDKIRDEIGNYFMWQHILSVLLKPAPPIGPVYSEDSITLS